MRNVFSIGWEDRILPKISTDEPCVVYWIYDDTCTRPENDGYVGVTTLKRLSARTLEHKRSGKLNVSRKIKTLIESNIEACYMFEAVLRPYPNMGWNRCAGGARGHKIGIPKDLQTRIKIGASNSGNIRKDLSDRNRSRARLCSCMICRKQSSAGYLYRDHRDCLASVGRLNPKRRKS